MDPTGEVLHIFGGITLGGIFGFGGGFIGSIIDQKKRGRKVDWRKAFGSGINGAITGAAQGGLLASGAGLPTALLTNFFAGAAGSAAEQYIGTGTADPGSSITRGLTNAVSNAIYGTNPLRSARDAFLRGAGAGAATSGINYLSDFIGQGNRLSGRRPGITPWVAGAALSPYGLHDPRLDCGGANPFAPGLGYHSDRGYQYDSPQSEGSQRKFSMWDFLGEVVMGGLTGGFTSAAFYGAGKGIERLKEGGQSSRGDTGIYENNVGNYLAGKAPKQVMPGVEKLQGQYIDDLGRIQPWKAYYDKYGRIIGRTDYNAGNIAQGIPDTHYHIYEWGPGKLPLERQSHIKGEYKP